MTGSSSVPSDVVGVGWTFPCHLTTGGEVALASGAEDVEQSIAIILGTAPGERPMRPEFGCDIHRLVFAPLDATTEAQADLAVRQALERWEPRIELDRLLFSTDTERNGVLQIDIRYRLRTTNEPRNLVYPFYTLPPAD